MMMRVRARVFGDAQIEILFLKSTITWNEYIQICEREKKQTCVYIFYLFITLCVLNRVKKYMLYIFCNIWNATCGLYCKIKASIYRRWNYFEFCISCWQSFVSEWSSIMLLLVPKMLAIIESWFVKFYTCFMQNKIISFLKMLIS